MFFDISHFSSGLLSFKINMPIVLLGFSEFFQYSKWKDINVNNSVLARTHRICVSNFVYLSTQFLLYIYKAVDKMPQIFWFLWLSPEGLQRSLLMLLQKLMVIKELILLCHSMKNHFTCALLCNHCTWNRVCEQGLHSLLGWNNHSRLALPVFQFPAFPSDSLELIFYVIWVILNIYFISSSIVLLICHIN